MESKVDSSCAWNYISVLDMEYIQGNLKHVMS